MRAVLHLANRAIPGAALPWSLDLFRLTGSRLCPRIDKIAVAAVRLPPTGAFPVMPIVLLSANLLPLARAGVSIPCRLRPWLRLLAMPHCFCASRAGVRNHHLLRSRLPVPRLRARLRNNADRSGGNTQCPAFSVRCRLLVVQWCRRSHRTRFQARGPDESRFLQFD